MSSAFAALLLAQGALVLVLPRVPLLGKRLARSVWAAPSTRTGKFALLFPFAWVPLALLLSQADERLAPPHELHAVIVFLPSQVALLGVQFQREELLRNQIFSASATVALLTLSLADHGIPEILITCAAIALGLRGSPRASRLLFTMRLWAVLGLVCLIPVPQVKGLVCPSAWAVVEALTQHIVFFRYPRFFLTDRKAAHALGSRIRVGSRDGGGDVDRAVVGGDSGALAV